MKRALVITAAALALVLASCSDDAEGRGDADVGEYDDTPAAVINMPDTFMNVAIKCDPAGFRIYSHTRQGPPIIMKDDSCKGRYGVPPVYREVP